MTKNERRARELLTDAIRFNVHPLALEHLRAIADKPTLTDNECRSIAINYPISYDDIRRIFPRASRQRGGAMFSRLYKRIQEKRVKAAHKRGFVWAMTAFFFEDMPLDEIEALTYPPPCVSGIFFDNCGVSETEKAFDRGARDALRILHETLSEEV